MATVSAAGGTNDSSSRGAVNIYITNTDDPQYSRSLISWSTQVYDNNASIGGYSYATGNTHYIDVAGARRGTWTGNYDFGSGAISSPAFPGPTRTGSFYIDHNATSGAASSINGTAVFDSVDTPTGDASATTGYLALTTYTAPSVPTSGSISRISGNTSFTASASGSSGGSTWTGRVISYVIQYSINGGGWTNYAGATSVAKTDIVTIRSLARSGTSYAWQSSAYSGVLATANGTPSQPSAPTVSVADVDINYQSQTVRISWSAPANNGSAITGYNIYRCDTSGNILATLTTTATTSPYYDTGGTIGTSYTYKIEAKNAIGTSDTSTQSSSVQVPGTPSAPTFGSNPPSKIGRNVTVSVAADASGYGKTVSGYYVQYQYASTSGGTYSAWSTPVAMSLSSGNYTYTYNLMTPALWYKFRVYAYNSITKNTSGTTFAYPHNNLSYTSGVNFSPSATGTTTMFVSAGGRRRRGADEPNPNTWQPTETAKRYNGTSWVDLTIAKRYDGTTWVDLT